jgi:hypothetical protein
MALRAFMVSGDFFGTCTLSEHAPRGVLFMPTSPLKKILIKSRENSLRKACGYILFVLAVVWTLQFGVRLLLVVGDSGIRSEARVWVEIVAYGLLVPFTFFWAAQLRKPKLPVLRDIVEIAEIEKGPNLGPSGVTSAGMVNRLNTPFRRIAFLLAAVGLVVFVIGLWLWDWRLQRYIDVSLQGTDYYLFRSICFWLGGFLMVFGMLGSYLYEFTIGRLVNWISHGH